MNRDQELDQCLTEAEILDKQIRKLKKKLNDTISKGAKIFSFLAIEEPNHPDVKHSQKMFAQLLSDVKKNMEVQ